MEILCVLCIRKEPFCVLYGMTVGLNNKVYATRTDVYILVFYNLQALNVDGHFFVRTLGNSLLQPSGSWYTQF